MTELRGSPPFQVTPNVNYSWCKTEMEEVKFGCVWTINTFSLLPHATGHFLRSSPFSSSESDTNKWFLELYPRGDKNGNEDYVSLFLCHEPEFHLIADFEISLLKDSPTADREKANCMKESAKCFLWESEGFPQYIKRDYLMSEGNRLLKNDELTICCEVVIPANPKATTGRYNCAFVENTAGSNRLTDDLGHLLNTKHYCDVVLVAEDQELHAHKNLLGARSPVFHAMFQHDMEENRQNRVVISDIGFKVLEELVRFIYTGKLPDMDDEMLMQLFSAGDKYALEDLMEMCDRALSVKLNAENVVKLIPLASLQNTKHLKARLIEFMKSVHSTDDAVTELWNLLISQHPELVARSFKAKRKEK